ncbi:MAG: 4a-hydroxytetrahydrobiopterin dehydratase [Microthrixaceae bacterium]
MARPTAFSSDELDQAVGELPGWSVVDQKLHREFVFGDFACAFGFMAAAATYAEKLDHHPEWSNVYARVTVDLTTHDAGGITELDVRFARRLNELAGD